MLNTVQTAVMQEYPLREVTTDYSSAINVISVLKPTRITHEICLYILFLIQVRPSSFNNITDWSKICLHFLLLY